MLTYVSLGHYRACAADRAQAPGAALNVYTCPAP